jgi:hypothetical protein
MLRRLCGRGLLRGWINYVRYADTWGLRRQVLAHPLRRP